MGDQDTQETRDDPITRAPRKGFTPPKGRPTRGRDERYGRPRVFGPVAQWIALALLLLLVFAVLILLTDGGDFNPFNDDTATPVARQLASTSIGSLSHWM